MGRPSPLLVGTEATLSPCWASIGKTPSFLPAAALSGQALGLAGWAGSPHMSRVFLAACPPAYGQGSQRTRTAGSSPVTEVPMGTFFFLNNLGRSGKLGHRPEHRDPPGVSGRETPRGRRPTGRAANDTKPLSRPPLPLLCIREVHGPAGKTGRIGKSFQRPEMRGPFLLSAGRAWGPPAGPPGGTRVRPQSPRPRRVRERIEKKERRSASAGPREGGASGGRGLGGAYGRGLLGPKPCRARPGRGPAGSGGGAFPGADPDWRSGAWRAGPRGRGRGLAGGRARRAGSGRAPAGS